MYPIPLAWINVEIIAISIPIISIIGGVVIAIVAILGSARRKELMHKERIIAMEKGIPLPDDPLPNKRPAYLHNRSTGLVMVFVGIALTIALWTTSGAEAGVWGLIPLGVGVALLISSVMESREGPSEPSQRAAASRFGSSPPPGPNAGATPSATSSSLPPD